MAAGGAPLQVRVEQLSLELGELAVRRERCPCSGAFAQNSGRMSHHGHSDVCYRREVRNPRPCRYYDRVLRPVSIFLTLVAVLLLAGCGGGNDASKAEFTTAMVSARNEADSGLEQIVYATSWEDLMARMKVAAVDVRGAAGDVRKADAPSGLKDERDLLADPPGRALGRDHLDGRDVRGVPDPGAGDPGAQLRAVEHRAGFTGEPAARGDQGPRARAAQARDPAAVAGA